jgi:ABC-type nitrate/sulfonate/bicarbonate transport system substrate-binding protein
MTTIDPAVAEAADGYVGQPVAFGLDDDNYRTTGRDAFVAGVEWSLSHDVWDRFEAANAYATKRGHGNPILRIEMVDAFLAGVRWTRENPEEADRLRAAWGQ